MNKAIVTVAMALLVGCAGRPLPASVGVRLPDGTECRAEVACVFDLGGAYVPEIRHYRLAVFNDGDQGAVITNIELDGDPALIVRFDISGTLAPQTEEWINVDWQPLFPGVTSADLSVLPADHGAEIIVELVGRATEGV